MSQRHGEVKGRKVAGVRERVPVVFESTGIDRTKQSFKDHTDINHIMSRYLRSGNVDWISKHGPGEYGYVEAQTFHEAMNVVARAQEMFADLPSDVRKRFANDVGGFLAFIGDAKNIDEMRKLKLVEPEKPPEPEPLPRKVLIVGDEREEAFGDDGTVSVTRGPRPPSPSSRSPRR